MSEAKFDIGILRDEISTLRDKLKRARSNDLRREITSLRAELAEAKARYESLNAIGEASYDDDIAKAHLAGMEEAAGIAENSANETLIQIRFKLFANRIASRIRAAMKAKP